MWVKLRTAPFVPTKTGRVFAFGLANRKARDVGSVNNVITVGPLLEEPKLVFREIPGSIGKTFRGAADAKAGVKFQKVLSDRTRL